ncbi:MAG: hypothetical protein ACRDQ4_20005 [Pseudonocardiaceae bacterium]
MRNNVPTTPKVISGVTSGATHERKLSAALRAQACGVGLGSPLELASHPRPAGAVSPGRGPAHAKPRPSASVVLVLAALLGAMAGGLAGVISIW